MLSRIHSRIGYTKDYFNYNAADFKNYLWYAIHNEKETNNKLKWNIKRVQSNLQRAAFVIYFSGSDKTVVW